MVGKCMIKSLPSSTCYAPLDMLRMQNIFVCVCGKHVTGCLKYMLFDCKGPIWNSPNFLVQKSWLNFYTTYHIHTYLLIAKGPIWNLVNFLVEKSWVNFYIYMHTYSSRTWLHTKDIFFLIDKRTNA